MTHVFLNQVMFWCTHALYLTEGYSPRVEHRVAICAGKNITALKTINFVQQGKVHCTIQCWKVGSSAQNFFWDKVAIFPPKKRKKMRHFNSKYLGKPITCSAILSRSAPLNLDLDGLYRDPKASWRSRENTWIKHVRMFNSREIRSRWVGAIVSNVNNSNNSLWNKHAQFDMHHGERGRKWKRDFQTFQGDKMLMFSTQE